MNMPVCVTFRCAIASMRRFVRRVQIVIATKTSRVVRVYFQWMNEEVQIGSRSSGILTPIRANNNVRPGRHIDLHARISYFY